MRGEKRGSQENRLYRRLICKFSFSSERPLNVRRGHRGRGWTAQLESANMHHSKQAAKWKEIAQIDRRHQRKSIGVAAWKCTRSGSRGGEGRIVVWKLQMGIWNGIDIIMFQLMKLPISKFFFFLKLHAKLKALLCFQETTFTEDLTDVS